MYKKVMILIITILLFSGILFANQIIIDIYCSDPADGFFWLKVDNQYIVYENSDDHHFNQGNNHLVYQLSNDDETHLVSLQYDAWTSWSAGYTDMEAHYVEPNNNFTYSQQIYFWHPIPMNINIHSNTNCDIANLKLYNQNDHILKDINIEITQDMTTNIRFDDIVPGSGGYFPPESSEYENCYFIVSGITEYGDTFEEHSQNNFVYNSEIEEYENNEIDLHLNHYHNFSGSVKTNVNISNAEFKLKDPDGNTVSTQVIDKITGNHQYYVYFQNILNPQGIYQPAEYKIYYQGASIEGELISIENTNNLSYDETTNYWNSEAFIINYTSSSEIKSFHSGWNWTSFPRLHLTGPGQDPIWVLDPLTPFLSELIYPNPLRELVYENGGWSTNTINYIFRKFGYKLNMLTDNENYELTVLGEQEDIDSSVALTTAHENWIGYWIPYTQEWRDAISNTDLEHITSIKAENWYVYKKNDQWYGMIGENGATFEYGKSYVITVDQNFYLHWQHLNNPVIPYQKEKAENFSYEEKSDYKMIEIEAVEDGENILEIGVFQGDKCVGASKVEEYPVHILAYTDEFLKDEDLSFEVITSEKNRKRYNKVLNYNFETKQYEPAIVSAENNFMLIKLDKKAEDSPITNKLNLKIYPNPFNPETQISFTLPKEGKVILEIFNIKGQLIKTLIRGNLSNDKQVVVWDGTDNMGKRVSSGIYFCKIITEKSEKTKKMILLK